MVRGRGKEGKDGDRTFLLKVDQRGDIDMRPSVPLQLMTPLSLLLLQQSVCYHWLLTASAAADALVVSSKASL